MPADTSAPRKKARDARGFWRVFLAIIVPLPWLAKGIQYIIHSSPLDSLPDQIRFDLTHPIYGELLQWLDLLFVVLVVPSIIGMALVARRGAPVLTTIATLVAGGGFLAALTLNNGGNDWIAWAAAQTGADPDSTGKLLEGLADPRQGIGVLGFMLAIIVGSILIGLALRRSKAIPVWAAILIIVGGGTHPFLSFENHIHGAGLVVLAIGAAVVSARLLRTSNDDYDLAPLDRAEKRAADQLAAAAAR